MTIVQIENAIRAGIAHSQLARQIVSEAGLDGQLSTLQREIVLNSIEGLICLLKIATKAPGAVQREPGTV